MITYTNFIRHTKNLLKRGWTQNAMARDASGVSVPSSSSSAVKFCLAGAMTRTFADLGEKTRKVYNKIWWEVSKKGISKITSYHDNKNRTKRQILRKLDEALISCKKGR